MGANRQVVLLAGLLAVASMASGLWPQPRQWTSTGDSVLTLDPNNLTLQISDPLCNSTLQEHFARLQSSLHRPLATPDPTLTSLEYLRVEIEDPSTCQQAPGPSEDESYSLNVNSTEGVINATTIWGALHGLTTFVQLPYLDAFTRQYRLNVTEIRDSPTFSHRGLLLDTSQRFVSPDVIKKYLVGMSLNKLNVLHWRIVGDRTWSFQTLQAPELAIMGAHTPFHVYTEDMVKEIVHFAESMGIRVVPEFNVPGGAGALSKSHPELTVTCGDGKTILKPESSEEFLEKLFANWKVIFNTSQFHVGLSGFNLSCWESQDHNGSIADHFAQSTVQSLLNNGMVPIIWGEAIAANISVDPEAIVQLRTREKDLMSTTLSHGHSVIVSSCWHLSQPYTGQQMWQDFYVCRLNASDGRNGSRVLGGEVTYCSCLVDGTNLISTIWPAASAVAERLWSNPEDSNSMDEVTQRLQQQRCLMLKQGLPIPPLKDDTSYQCEEEWHADQNVDVSMEMWQQWQKDRTPTTTPQPTTTAFPESNTTATDDHGDIIQPSAGPSKSGAQTTYPSVIILILGFFLLLSR